MVRAGELMQRDAMQSVVLFRSHVGSGCGCECDGERRLRRIVVERSSVQPGKASQTNKQTNKRASGRDAADDAPRRIACEAERCEYETADELQRTYRWPCAMPAQLPVRVHVLQEWQRLGCLRTPFQKARREQGYLGGLWCARGTAALAGNSTDGSGRALGSVQGCSRGVVQRSAAASGGGRGYRRVLVLGSAVRTGCGLKKTVSSGRSASKYCCACAPWIPHQIMLCY